MNFAKSHRKPQRRTTPLRRYVILQVDARTGTKDVGFYDKQGKWNSAPRIKGYRDQTTFWEGIWFGSSYGYTSETASNYCRWLNGGQVSGFEPHFI